MFSIWAPMEKGNKWRITLSEDINAAILAELKEINMNLSYIKAVAQRLNDAQNQKGAAIRRMASSLPPLVDPPKFP